MTAPWQLLDFGSVRKISVKFVEKYNDELNITGPNSERIFGVYECIIVEKTLKKDELKKTKTVFGFDLHDI